MWQFSSGSRPGTETFLLLQRHRNVRDRISAIMADLGSLFEASSEADVLTIEATVDTGFETFAAKECRDKFGSTVQVCHSRGRIYINVPSSQYYLVSCPR